jgi:hypothetical protein
MGDQANSTRIVTNTEMAAVAEDAPELGVTPPSGHAYNVYVVVNGTSIVLAVASSHLVGVTPPVELVRVR